MSAQLMTEDLVVPVGSVQDIAIPGDAGPIPARVYRPEASGTVPTVLFTHGGAFFEGDIETHDNQARWLCKLVSCVVVSINYRLIPEHPFPAGLDDVNASVRWVFGNVSSLGGDAACIGLAGDSAGGGLTAVAAQEARDAGLNVKAQLLLYPVVDLAVSDSEQSKYGSREDFAEGYILTWPGLGCCGHSRPMPQDRIRRPRGSRRWPETWRGRCRGNRDGRV
jgi:acetyl esterase